MPKHPKQQKSKNQESQKENNATRNLNSKKLKQAKNENSGYLKNEKNNMIKIFKKLSFLWIVIGALAIHFIVKGMNLEPKDELGKLIILWLIFSAVMFNMLLYRFNKTYKDGWDDSQIAEFDVVGISNKKTDKRIYIEGCGITEEALVEKVSRFVMGQNFAVKATYVIITYSFFHNKSNKITKIKKYYDQILQNIPKVGDKIKILYDPLNPNDSVIFHEKINEKAKN